jgi:hypothetical protein
LEEHTFSHEEDVCTEEDQTIAYETSSGLYDEADGISVLDGYTSDESTQEEDAGYYDDLFQSADVEGPTYITMYDEGIPSVITLPIDEDSMPYLSYNDDDDEDVIVPRQGLEDQLLVKEEQIVQVLIRADNTHKYIEDLMWKAQMDERQKGVADGITSAQLRIIKEALERMKSDYLQLFIDRDLALKFDEDKEREIEELCYQLSLAHSSSLTTTKTPSSLVAVTHEGMSGTHDLREEPLVMIPQEEHSELQVFEERFDIEGFDYAPVLHCMDHESFLLAQGLATEMVVKQIPCEPANKEVYAPVDRGTEYRTNMDTSL